MMKKDILVKLLVTFTVAVSLFTGCDRGTGVKETEDDGKIHVSTVEELLESIEPGAVIVVDAGTYNMTDALDDITDGDEKDWNKEHEYVKLADNQSDGLQINICGVDDLTICGEDGKKVELKIEPRYSDVLYFEECDNLVISNLVLGHTDDGICCGDVLEIHDSENVQMDNLDIYGCGYCGIAAYNIDGLTLEDSVIRDCNGGIVDMYKVTGLNVKNCELHDNICYTCLWMESCEGTFMDCSFYDNECSWDFLTAKMDNDVEFKDCEFGTSEQYMIATLDSVEGFVFNDGCNVTLNNSEYTVSDVAGLIEAICPYETIVLEPGNYNISEYIEQIDDIDDFNNSHEYVRIEEVYDGYQLVIQNVDVLEMTGESESWWETEIQTDPRYADVIAFENCSGVSMSNMTLGHTFGAGDCVGNVVGMYNCNDFSFYNMDMYGCGVYGIYANNCENLYVESSNIHDCSFGPMCLNLVSGDVSFEFCRFYDSDGSMYIDDVDGFTAYFFSCDFGYYESELLYMMDNIYLDSYCTTTDVLDDSDTGSFYSGYGYDDDYDIYYDPPIGVVDGPDGYSIAQNELLIMAEDGYDYDYVTTQVGYIGADVVGYIGLSNEYQIRFRYNISNEDLEEEVEYLEELDWVVYVDYNYTFEET